MHDKINLLISDDTGQRKDYGIKPQEFCIRCNCITDLCGSQQLAYIPVQETSQVEVSI